MKHFMTILTIVTAILMIVACHSTTPKTPSLSQDAHSETDTLYPHLSTSIHQPIQRIAFGSCSREDKDQSFWNQIKSTNPDLWIWLGDIIYGDSEDKDVMWSKYQKLFQNIHYQNFIKDIPALGIWDDHDYGINDGGKDFPAKKQNKDLFFDFFQQPAPPYPGIYRSFHLGQDDRDFKLILLDTRSFKDKPTPDKKGDVLGEEQWYWLENDLANDETSSGIIIIASGIQVLSEEHAYETWGQFPEARKRLLNLACAYPNKTFIAITGDRHIAELSKQHLPECGRNWYDLTSSGLTHAWNTFPGEPNKHRVSEVYTDRHFGIIDFDWDAYAVILNIISLTDQTEVISETIPIPRR